MIKKLFNNKKLCYSNGIKNDINIFIGIVLWLAVSFVISGCDVCFDSSGSGQSDGDVFYTALPISKELPHIYSISPNGRNLKEILRNGIIYSSPSSNGKLAYLQNTSEGADLRIVNIDGSNDISIIKDFRVDEGSITFPIIQPNGMNILFVGGRNTLYIVDNKGQSAGRITLNFAEETLPSFSKDGKHFAFFENSGSEGGFFVKVFNTDSRKEVFAKYYSQGINDLNGMARVDWSKSNNLIIYAIRLDNKDVIYINDIYDQGLALEKSFEIDSSTGSEMPVFSPDEQYFAFITRKGDLFIRNMSTTNPIFRQLTFNSENEVNRYPEWSKDGRSILFNNYYKFEDLGYRATLMIINNIDKEPQFRETLILSSNNVFRGFWWIK